MNTHAEWWRARSRTPVGSSGNGAAEMPASFSVRSSTRAQSRTTLGAPTVAFGSPNISANGAEPERNVTVPDGNGAGLTERVGPGTSRSTVMLRYHVSV